MKINSLSFLLSFFTCSAFGSPLWYHNINNTQQNYYIGYAQASSEAEAKKIALRDIASQLSVTIESSYTKELRLTNASYNKNVVDNTNIQTHAKLNGYEVLRLGFEEGVYFIALGYENIASTDKFNRALEKMSFTEPELQNRYLSHTPIARELSKKVDFSLTRKEGDFYIKYGALSVPLSRDDLSHFFATVDNVNLSISSSKGSKSLREGDEFYFNIVSAKEGFVSIFSVYEDGTVSSLVRNIHVKAKRVEPIPDKEYESVLQAGLIEPKKSTFDLYVVIYSEKKEHYDLFACADDELISDERYKNFDELIERLDKVEFASIKIETKPR